jgi:Zn-dependent protease with chaperone function
MAALQLPEQLSFLLGAMGSIIINAIGLLILNALVGSHVAHAAETLDPEAYEATIEAKIREDVKAAGPEAEKLWNQAEAAEKANDKNSSKEALKQLTTLAPNLDHGHRFLCMTKLGLDDVAGAAASCKEALRLNGGFSRNRSRLAFIEWRQNNVQEADRILRLGTDRADFIARFVTCHVAAELNSEPTARDRDFLDCSKKIATDFPKNPTARGLRSQVYLAEGDIAAANRELEEATRLGLAQEEREHIRKQIDEKGRPSPALLVMLGFLGVLVLWLTMLGSFWSKGTRLSESCLLAVEEAMRGKIEPITDAERRMRKRYQRTIGLISIFFFLSLPFVGLLTVLFVVLLCGISLYVGQVPYRLLFFVGLAALVSLYAIAQSLVTLLRYKEKDPGEEIQLDGEPALAEMLRGVAEDMGTRPIDRVFVTPGTEMAVYERGSALSSMRGKGERCLVLGIGLLEGFSLRGFQSVLAHEYGHFRNEDTAGGHIAIAVRRSLAHIVTEMAKGAAAAWYNPAWWFIVSFVRIFNRVTQGASRLQEVLADRAAVMTYGSSAFIEGFHHIIRREVAFDLHSRATSREAYERQVLVQNFYAYAPQNVADPAEVQAREWYLYNAVASEEDSHPPPKDRVELATRMNLEGERTLQGEAAMAWSLFANREILEQRMTWKIRNGT